MIKIDRFMPNRNKNSLARFGVMRGANGYFGWVVSEVKIKPDQLAGYKAVKSDDMTIVWKLKKK